MALGKHGVYLRVHVVSLFEVFVFGVRVRQVVVFAFRAPPGARVSGQKTGQQGCQTRGEHRRQHRFHRVAALLPFVHSDVVVVGTFAKTNGHTSYKTARRIGHPKPKHTDNRPNREMFDYVVGIVSELLGGDAMRLEFLTTATTDGTIGLGAKMMGVSMYFVKSP